MCKFQTLTCDLFHYSRFLSANIALHCVFCFLNCCSVHYFLMICKFLGVVAEENSLKSLSSAFLFSRYILGLGQRGRCYFCASCPNRKMYLEIRNADALAIYGKKLMWFHLRYLSIPCTFCPSKNVFLFSMRFSWIDNEFMVTKGSAIETTVACFLR